MAKSKEQNQAGVSCGQPAGHRDHLCLLMEKGMAAQIAERTRHPAYSCANCGAKADQSEDLCQPRPLQSIVQEARHSGTDLLTHED